MQKTPDQPFSVYSVISRALLARQIRLRYHAWRVSSDALWTLLTPVPAFPQSCGVMSPVAPLFPAQSPDEEQHLLRKAPRTTATFCSTALLPDQELLAHREPSIALYLPKLRRIVPLTLTCRQPVNGN